jgi:hypothetical protein
MIGLIVGAALLGIIIAVMEGGEFPGWFQVIACALATMILRRLICTSDGEDIACVARHHFSC